MGPRLRSRGKWRPDVPSSSGSAASMGPRLRSRGKRQGGATSSGYRGRSLQWGRGFGAAESSGRRGRIACSRSCFNGAAASEPRKGVGWEPPPLFASDLLQWGRGFGAAESASRMDDPRTDAYSASMGPRLRSRGKARLRQAASCSVSLHQLQWGRGFGAAERPRTNASSCLVPSLQWGRGFGAAERLVEDDRRRPRARRASMGPRLRSRGKRQKQRADAAEQRLSASMGPRLRSRGKRHHGNRKLHLRSRPRFNGAAASEPRKVTEPAPVFAFWWRLQWGRGFGAAERPREAQPYERSDMASMGPRLRSRGKVTPPRKIR